MVMADFESKSVCLDTAPLIYFIEGNNQYFDRLLPLCEANANRRIDFITSSVMLLEVLVKPLRNGDLQTAQQYRDILSQSPTLKLFDVSAAVAEEAARLRAQYNFRTPDSIQLATSIVYGADIFLTNDTDLKRMTGLHIVTLAELT